MLPYKACITLPIGIPITKNAEMSAVEQRFHILGFLGIDTDVRDRYREPRDVALGAIVADTLYAVLIRSWDATAARRQKRATPATD